MKRKLLVAAGIILAVVVASAVYVGVRVRKELVAAQSVLGESPTSLTTTSIERADAHLESALGELNSPPAKILRLLPIARQNVLALEAVARATRPVLDSAAALEESVRDIESEGLLVSGTVNLGLIRQLKAPLEQEVSRLGELEQSAQENRSGWLVPMIWDEIDTLLRRAQELHSGARKAHGLVQVADDMLGGAGQRTYLIVLLNNAELRGAGGIPSGLGTLTIENGELRLGPFSYAPDLRGPRPFARVKAPSDFRRRYGRFWADRTFWVNTTMSSDVPDVAAVASRLYARIPGRETDGVLFADPHGVAALMRSDASIEASGSAGSLSAAELPDYAYSGVYEEEEAGVVDDRHDALLRLGELAFQEIFEGGLGSRQQITAVADAFGAGHLRFVSFDAEEQGALQAAAASGDIRPPRVDSLFVTAYNTGADKLDYWGRRSVKHYCVLGGDETAECSTTVTLRNVAPDGLPRLVAARPYGVLTNFLEIYIPDRAELLFVERNGKGTEYFKDRQDGHATVGFDLRLEPGDEVVVEVGYELDFDGAYVLEVMPQPLAHPATLDVLIDLPNGWIAHGPGGDTTEEYSYSGRLDQTMSIVASIDARTGLSSLWGDLVGFWNDPVG